MKEDAYRSQSAPPKSRSHRFWAAVKKLLSIPKTVYFNFVCFDWATARKLPVLVAYETRLKDLRRGRVAICCIPQRFMVKIGFGGTDSIMPHRSNVYLPSGQVRFHGHADLSEGISLSNTGEMDIGANCFTNVNCTLWCSQHVSIGNDFTAGWNVLIRDSDGHCMMENGEAKPCTKPIRIGNHCWVGSDSTVMKGSEMGNDSVLAMRSLLNKPWPQEHILLAGTPARPVKENISWQK